MKLQYKLFILFILLILIFGTATIISTSIILKKGLEYRLIAREKIGLEILEHRIFPHIANKDYEKVTAILFEEKAIKKESVYYIAVHDKDGNILAHTFLDEIPEQVKHHVHNKDIGDFLISEFTINNVPLIEITLSIREGTYEVGHLAVGYKKEHIENIVSQIIRTILIVIIILIILSVILSFLLSKLIVRPIKELSRGMEDVGRGNLSYEIKIDSKDEIGALASSFNRMTGDLQKITVSKDYVDNIIKSMNDTLIVVAPDSSIQTINDATCKLLGYEEKELIGQPIKVIFEEGLPHNGTVMDNVFTNGFVSNVEKTYLTKDGRKIPVLFSASVMHGIDCNLHGIVCAATDITERKRAEESLKKTMQELGDKTVELESTYIRIEKDRNNLRSALDIFSEIISEVEKKRGFEDYIYKPPDNPYIPTCWETKKCEYKGCPIYGQRNIRCWQIAGTHCEGKVQGQFAEKFSDCKECEVYKESVRDPVHEIGETFNNMMHILQSKHEELISARYVAEEASRLKTDFLANMSHEIRTPMNGILGMTSLAMDTELTDEQRDYLNNVQKSGYALLEIINNILDFSKIEAGRLPLDNIDFNLRLAIEGVVDTIAPMASEKRLELSCLVHHEVPSLLRGDSGRIRQILLNLGSNAVKFTEKGEVTIMAELIKETADTAFVLFSVNDTGVGIPQNKQKTIFEPFMQADSSITRMYGGTGLGLSISKKLVNMMGGEIGIESEPGKGSRFWFTLGIEKQKEKEGIKEESHTDIKGLRVLVVDDSETNRTILVKMLEGFGCRPEAVSSGAEAIEAVKKAVNAGNPYGVLLLDMQMPGMDGEHTTIIIKNTPKIKNIAIIILTSLGSRGDVARLRNIGCEGYLVKPVKQSLLLDTIATIMGSRETIKETASRPVVTRHTITERKFHNIRILLVEDNLINQKMAETMLKKAGYNVDVAKNGRIAVEAVDKINYDIILMDVQMPEMNGFEATKIIREKEKENNKKHNIIIAMTAHALRGDREQCIKAGMDDYISKPINPEEVFNVIRKWVKTKIKKSSDETEIKQAPAESPQKEDEIEKSPVDMKSAMLRFGNDKEFYK